MPKVPPFTHSSSNDPLCKEGTCGWEPTLQLCSYSTCKMGKLLPLPSKPQTFPHTEWYRLLDESIKQIQELSHKKGGEYSGDDDRLANFRRNGQALGLPMETIWAVYAAKHYDAIMQYIKDQRSGKTRERLEPIAGRVDDLLVYLLLFKAMLQESNNV